MTDDQIEVDGRDAPHLTEKDIAAVIVGADYYIFPGTTVTVCCLKLRNGYCIIGESATVSQANFNEELGRDIARQNAEDKIWALEGYLLRERLNNPQTDIPLYGG